MRNLVTFLLLIAFAVTPSLTFGNPNSVDPTALTFVTEDGWEVVDPPSRDDAEDDSVYYSYGFEDGWGGWTSVDNTATGVMWHLSEMHAFDGLSWWCADEAYGGYNNHWLQYMDSPVLNLTDFDGENISLTFMLFHDMEQPEGAEAPYNGWDGTNVWISTDGGENWEVFEPVSPAYQRSSLYSFGFEFGMGPDIPGWVGTSDGWVDCEFDLTEYGDQDDVMIRWAFCSDPAWSTADGQDDNEAISVLLDDILIMSGDDEIFANNGDGEGDADEFTFESGPVSGDFWELSEENPHSGDWAAHCPIEVDLLDALVSPPIEVPGEPWYTYFDFWVHTHTLNHNPDGDASLDDFFLIEVSTDQINWEWMITGYSMDQIWENDYHFYGPDTSYHVDNPEWKRKLNLTQFGGQTIWLRWQVRTDTVMSDNEGSGFWIDDFRLNITQRRQFDVTADEVFVAYPTALDLETSGSVTISNVGMSDFFSVRQYYSIDNLQDVPVIPFRALNAAETRTINFTLNSRTAYPYADVVNVYGIAKANEDDSPENNSAVAANVRIMPEGIWMLGYDTRSIVRWFPDEFAQGSGPAVLYTPEDDGIEESFDMNAIRVQWNGLQDVNEVDAVLHIFADNNGVPGDELHSGDITVLSSETNPAQQVIDLTDVEAVKNMNSNFWIWFEITRDDQLPAIVGDDENEFGTGHYYSYNGEDLTELEYQFLIHPVLMPVGFELNIVSAGRENIDFEGVAPNASLTKRVALYNGGTEDVTISALSIEGDAFTVELEDGVELPATLRISDLIHAYVTFSPVAEVEYDGILTVENDGLLPAEVPLMGVGDGASSAPDARNVIPAEYALGQAYPNPFNAQTVIPFALPIAGNTKLAVFDLSGRQIAELASGYHSAGNYEVAFDATGLSAGVYIYRLETSNFSSFKKVVLVK
ncbi:MAG: T9SS type A sorting domain-containing protein [Calditrichaeota bacterium]|jgi:hypothetical protein|nr:T9SS type A sorting domain-containing protein [Calditrichota bacterium]MBT7617195.1 T9SS type A sorting domain-containing protein [Calditrichota bacterium]MBT7788630.1 T9SS type A sorting domain-containing protein [Calditrichota bacterium]